MADAFDDEVDAEPTISIGDYLKAVEEEELEADLVLGGDEGKECTYNKGYLKRQAIFSCLTCTPDGNAGVCTACSLSCHDGHEVLELWTKRNFKCDCGNSKFGEFFCKLMASKDVENSANKYNHNFKGTYCTCDLPYPDPDVEEQVEMIQCCVCEDWFHEEHIGLQPDLKIPRDEEGEPLYEDFICQGCAKLCSFLSYYPQIISAPNTSDNSTSGDLKEKAVLENTNSVSAGTHENGSCPLERSSSSNVNSNTSPPEANNMEGEAKECTEVAGQSSECIFEHLVGKGVPPSTENNKPLFLSKNWRETLCTCGKCSEMYAQNGISFLLDKEDSIAEYEKVAKQRRSENMQKQEGAEMSFLNNLGHVEKMEILSGIADMKNEIFSFLESSDPSKPITTADVQQYNTFSLVTHGEPSHHLSQPVSCRQLQDLDATRSAVMLIYRRAAIDLSYWSQPHEVSVSLPLVAVSAHDCWYFGIQQGPRLTLFVPVEVHKCSCAALRHQPSVIPQACSIMRKRTIT
ncbi:PHD finger protein-related [Striga hermonthica]|uniref:PHD finger protein-related n=1 Tax=Striga hermonthica TaxID=68872 RepID=A0A9N7RN78_STRHE|nr:PHD finger protein-related [Striga hermonthica]